MVVMRYAMNELVTLYRPVEPLELEAIRDSGFARFPARRPGQPLFYPLAQEDYARAVARESCAPAAGVGYVTRFQVDRGYLSQFPLHPARLPRTLEYWVPAEELDEFNDHIQGRIEVVAEYRDDDGSAGRESDAEAEGAGDGEAIYGRPVPPHGGPQSESGIRAYDGVGVHVDVDEVVLDVGHLHAG